MNTFVRAVPTLALALAVGMLLMLPEDGWTQQKRKFTEKNLAANTKYTQQHVIDVGDVPGHQVRIYELRYVWPADPPTYDGVRAVEAWARGYSDYTAGSGRSWGHFIEVMENGDKIFSRYDGTSQASANPDGSVKRTYHGVRTIIGGTGKFRGIRGVVKNTVAFDPTSGLNEGHGEGEYWFE